MSTPHQHTDLMARIGKGGIVTIIALGLGEAIALGTVIYLIWQMVDHISREPQNALGLLPLIAAFGVAALSIAGLRTLQFSVTERIGLDVVRRLRMVIYGHMSGMAPRQIQHRSRGSLILRLTGDLTMLRTWISRGIGRGIISATVIACGTVLMALFSVKIALSVLAIFALGAVVSMRSGKRLAKLTRSVRRRRSLVTSNIDEQINALSVVQLFGRSKGESARLSRQNEALTHFLRREANVRGILRGISTATGWLAVLAVLVLGAFEVSAGQMSIGALAAVVTVVRYLNTPFRNLGLAHDYWRRAQVSQRKLDDFLRSSTRELNDTTKEKLRVRRGEIVFENVSVEGVLHNLNLTAKGGSHIALMGHTGAGKSSLLGLVSRMSDPDQGQICIDGQNLSDCTLISTYDQIGVVSPDLPLMRGTVRRNLTYRHPDATEAEINQIIAACNLGPVLAALPDGLDSWITEGGMNLSLGQRQLLALARAMLGNPPVLLLDEPMANLDAPTRQVVQTSLNRYCGTILTVTHDKDEALCADEVWTLESGAVKSVESRETYRQRQLAEDQLHRRGLYMAAS